MNDADPYIKDADPSAALEAIRDRAGVVAKLGPPRPGGDLINAAHRSAADVPRLLAAVEAVLEEADDFEANRPERLVTRRYAAECFRAAITRALKGDTDA